MNTFGSKISKMSLCCCDIVEDMMALSEALDKLIDTYNEIRINAIPVTFSISYQNMFNEAVEKILEQAAIILENFPESAFQCCYLCEDMKDAVLKELQEKNI